MRSPMLLAAIGLALAACQGASRSPAHAAADTPEAKLLPLAIQTARGRIVYHVEVARSEAEQQKGLMFRTSLPDRGGMLFPFDRVRPATFWMKNTPLPLDIIFIRPDGTIARIAAQTTPYSLDMIDSGEPVKAVLEIMGGAAAKAGIAEGDRVSW